MAEGRSNAAIAAKLFVTDTPSPCMSGSPAELRRRRHCETHG